MSDNLGELFREARQYGRVRLSTQETGCYYACIEFDTIKHTTLEAKSSFKEKTPDAALKAAIKAAQTIVDSISNIAKERKLIA